MPTSGLARQHERSKTVRLVLAIVSITLAALMIGFGLLQRLVLAGPDHITAAVATTSDATVTVIDGAALNAFDRGQTVMASGADTIFAAYGRTTDVIAWVGPASYNAVSYDAETQELVATVIDGDESEVPNPAGSDLWLADYTQPDELEFTVNVPEDISIIIVSDGVEPAPSDVSVTWLIDNSTPFAGPLILGGGIIFLLGLIFLLWAINHMRRMRGPRRRPVRLPKVPRGAVYKPVKRGGPQPASTTRGRRTAGMTAVPLMLVGVILLAGCTSDNAATLAGGESGSAGSEPSNSVEDVSTLETPAVTSPQANRIVTRVAEIVAEADAANDSELVATRMGGPALELRTASYAIRKVVTDAPAPSVIPPSTVQLVLPQQQDAWPRTVFIVVRDQADATTPWQALMLIQEDPRSQYKVHYSIALQPGALIPDVAGASIGASRLDEDVKFFTMAPAEVAAAYADILMKDTESEYFELFEATGDGFRVSVGKAYKDDRIAKVPTTAKLTFVNAPGLGQVIAMATIDGGAIVALSLAESETITPVEVGAAVNAPADVAALLGKSLSTKGITATYGDQLLFYLPSAASGDKIVLLGYTQGLISAVEAP